MIILNTVIDYANFVICSRESTPSSSVPSTSRTSLRPESNKLLADTQRRAIAAMSKIHEAVEGSFYSFSDVTQVLQFFLSRESKISAWNVNLELGSTQIPVTRFAFDTNPVGLFYIPPPFSVVIFVLFFAINTRHQFPHLFCM